MDENPKKVRGRPEWVSEDGSGKLLDTGHEWSVHIEFGVAGVAQAEAWVYPLTYRPQTQHGRGTSALSRLSFGFSVLAQAEACGYPLTYRLQTQTWQSTKGVPSAADQAGTIPDQKCSGHSTVGVRALHSSGDVCVRMFARIDQGQVSSPAQIRTGKRSSLPCRSGTEDAWSGAGGLAP